MVIHNPEIGKYQLQIVAKRFPVGRAQTYSLVISSRGYVDVSSSHTLGISFHDLTPDSCAKERGHLIRFQLEDFMQGSSWEDMYFTISRGSTVLRPGEGEVVYIQTFYSNHDRQDASTNRIEHFSVCLHPETHYVASIKIMERLEQGPKNLNKTQIEKRMKFIRVSSPECYLYLTYYWNHVPLFINGDGGCNHCYLKKSSLVDVIMTTTNTFDDDLTWVGHDGYYQIYSKSSHHLIGAGTLVVSDESADRCVRIEDFDSPIIFV